jgi:hypothetical protein
MAGTDQKRRPTSTSGSSGPGPYGPRAPPATRVGGRVSHVAHTQTHACAREGGPRHPPAPPTPWRSSPPGTTQRPSPHPESSAPSEEQRASDRDRERDRQSDARARVNMGSSGMPSTGADLLSAPTIDDVADVGERQGRFGHVGREDAEAVALWHRLKHTLPGTQGARVSRVSAHTRRQRAACAPAVRRVVAARTEVTRAEDLQRPPPRKSVCAPRPCVQGL